MKVETLPTSGIFSFVIFLRKNYFQVDFMGKSLKSGLKIKGLPVAYKNRNKFFQARFFSINFCIIYQNNDQPFLKNN